MTNPEIDLREFSRICFFSGAGLSAESGIPTYRGKGGTWNFYDYEDVACQRAFERDPEKVWDFHEARRRDVMACEPNDAHRAIAAIQRAKPDTAIVTQNIDGVLQRAGCRDVIELHGSLWRLRGPGGEIVENHEIPLSSRRAPNGQYWRPDIVWFGDVLRADVIDRAVAAVERCDCLLSIGTSGLVFPAADLPRLAAQAGAVCVEINPEATPMSPLFDIRIREPAARAMRRLWPLHDEKEAGANRPAPRA